MTKLQGVYPILAVPFDTIGKVDEKSLRKLVQFEIDAGVHGLGLFGMASEVYALSDSERERIAEIVVEETNHRVPIIMGSGSTGVEPAIQLSKMLEKLGAAALMVVPPYWAKPDAVRVEEYFKAVAASVNIPIMIQDAPNATGVTMTASLLASLSKVENIEYVKIETAPSGKKVTEVLKQSEGRLTVFGGGNSVYMYEEFRRGAEGTMPACEFPDACVEVWNLCQAGDWKRAKEVFYKYLPLMRYGTQPGVAMSIHKEILRRAGIFETAAVRNPNLDIDDVTHGELSDLLDGLDLYAFSWGGHHQ